MQSKIPMNNHSLFASWFVMHKVDVEKCIIQSFSLITLRLKIKAVYWIENRYIYGCLVFFKTPSRQRSLTWGLFYLSRVVSSHLACSGFSCMCSLCFILCLSLCLLFPIYFMGEVLKIVFSGLRIQWQCSGIAWRSREEDVKPRGRMLKW